MGFLLKIPSCKSWFGGQSCSTVFSHFLLLFSVKFHCFLSHFTDCFH